MVAANTRPLFVDVDEGNWFAVYRQYAGELTTHGQMGAAFSDENGELGSWDTYTNINSNGNPPWGGGGVGGTGVAQGRYPSALGTEETPIAIWNEYTGDTSTGSLYGGRPYYASDDFGWSGGSFAYPLDIDLLWDTDSKDLWVGSAAISYDDDEDMYVVNTVYNDWTRGNRYLFHSEAYEDGFIVFGEEQLIIDEVNDLVGGDDTGSFNTSPYVSFTPDGLGMAGVVGLFLGADTDTSPISNYHTGIFKLSDDHGASWFGGSSEDPALGHAPSTDGDGYYFIPDAVWDDLVATQFNYEYVDECDGTSEIVSDFWSYYEDDFKVDRDGNPHWSIQVLGCGAEYCYYLPESGIYHFTIDRDNLNNPGPVNSITGWNWSHIPLPTTNSTWKRPSGVWQFMDMIPQISLSRENPEVMYVVSHIGTPGFISPEYDTDGDGKIDDPCNVEAYLKHEVYPEYSEDIYNVVLSEIEAHATQFCNTQDSTFIELFNIKHFTWV